MKTLLLFALLFGSTLSTEAQVWQKTFGISGNDIGTCVTTDSEGNIIIGAQSDGTGDNDIIVFKLDSTGAMLWSNSYAGGQGANDLINDIQSTSDGGYISCIDVSNGGGPNAGVMKLDNNGGITFVKGLIGWVNEILETSSNEFMICGGGINLVKLDIVGDTVWTTNFEATNGDGSATMNDIDKSNDGNYVSAGTGTGSGFSSPESFFICKYDENGDTLWVRTVGYATGAQGYCVKSLSDGSTLLGGAAQTNNAFGIVKFDASGNVLWMKKFDNGGATRISKILESDDADIYVAGTTDGQGAGNNDFFLMAMDANGNHLWSNSYGSNLSDELNDATLDNNSNIIMVGKTLGFGASSNDIYVVKVDSNGYSSCNTITGNFSATSFSGISAGCAVNHGGVLSSISITSNLMNISDSVLCSVTPVGLQTYDMGFISIHPNPTSDILVITGLDEVIGTKRLEITSSIGEIVLRKESIKEELDVKELPTGVYFLNIIHEGGVETIRFVKQ
jgi:hypothetical protein